MKNHGSLRFVSRSFVAGLLALAGGSIHAQVGSVWVVDAAAGPGSDFLRIGDAVAAASANDTILVRSGVYESFTLISKNLAVVADEGADVLVFDGPRVSFTPDGPPNVLHGLDFVRSPGDSGLAWISTGDFGSDTWVSDCTTDAQRVYVSSSRVVLDHCDLRGPDAAESAGFGAQSALDQGISFVATFSSTLRGGDGFDGAPGVEPTDGAPAAEFATGAWSANTEFLGGDGGSGFLDAELGCLAAAAGAPAVRSEDWYYTNASDLTGGTGGSAAAGCGSPGDDGAEIELTGQFAQVVEYTTAAPVLLSPGVAREGQTLTFDWEGPAGAAILLVSPVPDFQHSSFSPLSPGSMPILVGLPFTILLLEALPAPGSTSASFVVPELGVGVESFRLFTQALHYAPLGATLTSGGARAVVLLDSSF